MSDKVEFVDYQESIAIKVGGFLISKGLDIADNTGMACSLVQASELGILRKDPEAKSRKYLFGLIKLEPRRGFLGTVWFSNSTRGASKQNWVFEAYGRKHVELVRQLAEEMALVFNVKIVLHLVREQPDVETFLSDYPDYC